MKHPLYLFPRHRLLETGSLIGESCITRLHVSIHALHVGAWHVHIVIGSTEHDIAEVANCVKEAARYGLRANRPIWTEGYDKRFCFHERSALTRIRYVQRHNQA